MKPHRIPFFPALLLALGTSLLSSSSRAASQVDIDRLLAEGYVFEAKVTVVRWLDRNGQETPSGCTMFGFVELSNGMKLECGNSGMSPGHDAILMRKDDYYKILVGSDTYEAKR